jgi:hypothetical protein
VKWRVGLGRLAGLEQEERQTQWGWRVVGLGCLAEQAGLEEEEERQTQWGWRGH